MSPGPCPTWPAVNPSTFEMPWVQSPLPHAYSYIQQIVRKLKTVNAKNTKKSPIHENADANITCDFVDGDISRSRSCQSNIVR